MNHDFDNEFETDDELKRGRSRRKEGRKYPSSGRTGRTSGTDSTGRSIGNTLLPDLPAEQAVQEEAAGQLPGPERAV